MRNHFLPILSLTVLTTVLTAGCSSHSATPPSSASGVAVPANPHIPPQMQQGRMTRVNGMRDAARQRGQMMHRAPGKP